MDDRVDHDHDTSLFALLVLCIFIFCVFVLIILILLRLFIHVVSGEHRFSSAYNYGVHGFGRGKAPEDVV